MAHRKLTAKEVMELIMADEGESERELSDSDSSVADTDLHQPIIPDDDSDATDKSDVESLESDIEDEDDTDLPEDPENYFATKNPSVKWKKLIGSRRGRPQAVNIVDANNIGPTQIVPLHFESPLEALKLTLPDDVLELVIRYTNQKYERYCHDHRQNFAIRRFHGYKPFTKEEVLAFIGLSFIAGAHKCNQQPIFDLYDSKFLPHFKAATSRDRLLLLIRFCRFDDADTKNNRKDDRFGHVREAWEIFNNRCRELYGLGLHVTIDEMLQTFHGRCRFRQYMPQKPRRYGIKYWILADAESHYCFNAIPYLGKEGDTPALNLGATAVTKLVEPMRNTHRNVTRDRFFTSVDLFKDLHKDNLSAVGTVKANRKNLPVKLFPSQAKERTVRDFIFAFNENTTMAS